MKFSYLIAISAFFVICSTIFNYRVSLVSSIFVNLSLLMSLLVLIVVTIAKFKIDRIALAVILLFLYQVTISIFSGLNRDIIDILLQSLFNIKFFLVVWGISYLSKYNPAKLQNIFLFLLYFAVSGFIINIIFGSMFFNFWGVEENVRVEGWLPRIVGFQLQPNKFAFVFAAIFLYYFFFRRTLRYSTLIMFVAGIAVILSGSRTTLLIFPLACFISLLYTERISRGTKLILITVFTFLLVVVLFSARNSWLITSLTKNFELMSSADNTYYIRGLMIFNSFVLADKFFPIGAGVATFGTLFSDGSVIYKMLGMDQLPHVKEMRGIFDSNFASILGEFGAVGLMGFYGLLWYICRRLLVLTKFVSQKGFILSLTGLVVIISFKGAIFMDGYLGLLFGLFYFLSIKKVK
jgi:hypothetical protein